MTSAIIVAAGKGTRFGPEKDKLFFEVCGRPVIAHTWNRFDQAAVISHLILVVRDGMQDAFNDLAKIYQFKTPYTLVVGGKERQDSVWNGLEAVPGGTTIVAIQDGARPCTDETIISNCVAAAQKHGAAVAAQPVVDTIKSSDNGTTISGHLDRSRLWAVQTPQCFRIEIIRRALGEVRNKGLLVTDDTAACELIGQSVQLVSSLRPNPKVTIPADLPYIEIQLNETNARRV